MGEPVFGVAMELQHTEHGWRFDSAHGYKTGSNDIATDGTDKGGYDIATDAIKKGAAMPHHTENKKRNKAFFV